MDKKDVIINWEAKEYLVRDRNVGWFVGLIAVGLVLTGVAVWLQVWTFAVLVVVSVVALMVYVKRPPRTLHYSLSAKGLSEGNKLYGFDQFKSFGVMNEGVHFSVVLTPRKRFLPRVRVYFPESQGEEIVDIFGGRLPMEPVKLDFLDKAVNFLRI
jgi:hypothetical protein